MVEQYVRNKMQRMVDKYPEKQKVLKRMREELGMKIDWQKESGKYETQKRSNTTV